MSPYEWDILEWVVQQYTCTCIIDQYVYMNIGKWLITIQNRIIISVLWYPFFFQEEKCIICGEKLKLIEILQFYLDTTIVGEGLPTCTFTCNRFWKACDFRAFWQVITILSSAATFEMEGESEVKVLHCKICIVTAMRERERERERANGFKVGPPFYGSGFKFYIH
jgi:hypothetical protein